MAAAANPASSGRTVMKQCKRGNLRRLTGNPGLSPNPQNTDSNSDLETHDPFDFPLPTPPLAARPASRFAHPRADRIVTSGAWQAWTL